MQFCMIILCNLQQSCHCWLLSGSLGHPSNTHLIFFSSLHLVLTQVSLSFAATAYVSHCIIVLSWKLYTSIFPVWHSPKDALLTRSFPPIKLWANIYYSKLLIFLFMNRKTTYLKDWSAKDEFVVSSSWRTRSSLLGK